MLPPALALCRGCAAASRPPRRPRAGAAGHSAQAPESRGSSVGMPSARTTSPTVPNCRPAGSRARASRTPSGRAGFPRLPQQGLPVRGQLAGLQPDRDVGAQLHVRLGHPGRRAGRLVPGQVEAERLLLERLGLAPFLGVRRLAIVPDGLRLPFHFLIQPRAVLGASSVHVAPFVKEHGSCSSGRGGRLRARTARPWRPPYDAGTRACRSRAVNVRWPSATSTITSWPGTMSPFSSRRDSWLSTSRWMVRRIGRAPNSGW